MATRKRTSSPFDPLITELHTLSDRIAAIEASADLQATKRARAALEQVTKRLSDISAELDPILRPASIFDPTDPTTAGRIVALTLVAQGRHPLAAIPDFYGAGVYAIYYTGKFEPYKELAGADHPIYIGKADPDDHSANNAIGQGTKLSIRLSEHAKSIRKAATTIDLNDFECRFLIVQSGFQKSAESYLIEFFRPIWNSEQKICFGLGKHGDSSETRGNKRSPWDTIHPGREWAASSEQDQKPREQILAQISQHFSKYPPYEDIHQIFDRFMSDMRQLPTDVFYTPANGLVLVEEVIEKSEIENSR
jgi:hypothetical protein